MAMRMNAEEGIELPALTHPFGSPELPVGAWELGGDSPPCNAPLLRHVMALFPS